MDFGICLLSVVPIRREPSDTSEMVTQLLFGELVVVNSRKGNWISIRKVYDNYEGWMDEKQIKYLDNDEFRELSSITAQFTMDLAEVVQDITNNRFIPVLIGSSIRRADNNRFRVAETEFKFSGQLTLPDQKFYVNSLLENALIFLNAPYLWGGLTPFGTDCSGFTQTVFKISGIKLLRDAAQQATQGETISLIDEAQAGDLAFFDNPEGTITHVGILFDKDNIIHASGKVRIDTIDHLGIHNRDIKRYTHKLRLIKRIF
ncbi:MAG: C40 family peptidase [Bacteroidales bacterium]